MSSIASSLSSVSNVSTDPKAAPSVDASLTSESTFLKLLVAQIKNQDPTNPTDSTQFVGQLTQYSALEQLIGINTGVKKLTEPATTAPVPVAAIKT